MMRVWHTLTRQGVFDHAQEPARTTEMARSTDRKANRRGPAPSSDEARRRMQATRRRDTRAELDLRSRLHRMGLRYRVDQPILKGLRRRADVVFRRERVAVFVDGCFWHACPQHATWPKANSRWWRRKIEANVSRDRNTDERLSKAGWRVLRIWEHESPDTAAVRVRRALSSRRR